MITAVTLISALRDRLDPDEEPDEPEELRVEAIALDLPFNSGISGKSCQADSPALHTIVVGLTTSRSMRVYTSCRLKGPIGDEPSR